MKLSILLPAAVLGMLSAPLLADQALNLEDETVRVNYSLGYQIGGDFKRQGVDMDPDAIVRGIADALDENEPQMDKDEMQATLMALKRKVTQHERQQRQQREVNLLDEGKKFMAANAEKPGVKSTDSGLQYRIIEEGTGTVPVATDRVTVNYKGSLPDGVEFDSGENVTFRLNGVIRGWTEGLSLVKEGAKWVLFIPPELGYGEKGAGSTIGPNETLIFDIELISFEPAAKAEAEKK